MHSGISEHDYAGNIADFLTGFGVADRTVDPIEMCIAVDQQYWSTEYPRALRDSHFGARETGPRRSCAENVRMIQKDDADAVIFSCGTESI
jgi:hypothetical protein